jgi:hypothetical protein
VHSNRDLETTTPVTPSDRRDRTGGGVGPAGSAAPGANDGGTGPDTVGLPGNRPEAAAGGTSTPAVDETEEPEEMSPGPSDVNGG